MLINVCSSYESSLHCNDHPGENSKGGSWPEIWATAPNLHCRPTDTNNRGVRRVVFPCYHVHKWFWYGFAWRVWLRVGVVHDHMITCMWMNGDWSRWLLQCGLLINLPFDPATCNLKKKATCNLQIVCRLQIKMSMLTSYVCIGDTQINVHGMFNNIYIWMILVVLVQITFECYLTVI